MKPRYMHSFYFIKTSNETPTIYLHKLFIDTS